MKKGVLIGIIGGAVLIVLVAGFFILSNGGSGSQQTNANPNQMVDCGKMTNPSCFSSRMSSCLPVTAQMTASDGITPIDLTFLGLENETCYFQRSVNNVLNLKCYFPKGTALTWDLIDQTFGNDKGLKSIVDSSCQNV